MHAHLIRLLSLSALTAGHCSPPAMALVHEAAGVTAPELHGRALLQPVPGAHDAKNYITRYQQNFTTLVQAQGDWLFRTREDLRTEFNTTPAGYRRLQQLHDAFKSKGVELVVVYQPTRGLVESQQAATRLEKATSSTTTTRCATTRPCSAVSHKWATPCRTCRR